MKTKKVFALLMAGLFSIKCDRYFVLAETEENDSTETTEENALDPEDDFDGGGKKIRVGLSGRKCRVLLTRHGRIIS